MNSLDQIFYVKSFLSKDLATKISEFAESQKDKFSEYGNSEKEFFVNTLTDDEPLSQEIKSDIAQYGLEIYKFVKESYSCNLVEFDSGKIHIAKFESGSGMHEHFDSNRPNDIATILYLNDSYVGGEIYFPEYGVSYKPQAGDLLCFPDTADYVHGVKPISSGTRYTTPHWFTRIV